MEPECSLPHSQAPAACLYLEPNKSSPCLPPSHFVMIHLIISFHLYLGLPNGIFPSVLPTKFLYTPLVPPTRTTCSAHIIPLHLMTRIIFGEQYRSLSFSLSNLFHSPVPPSLLGPNILLSTLFSNTLSLHFSLMWQTKLDIHTNQQDYLQFCISYISG